MSSTQWHIIIDKFGWTCFFSRVDFVRAVFLYLPPLCWFICQIPNNALLCVSILKLDAIPLALSLLLFLEFRSQRSVWGHQYARQIKWIYTVKRIPCRRLLIRNSLKELDNFGEKTNLIAKKKNIMKKDYIFVRTET